MRGVGLVAAVILLVIGVGVGVEASIGVGPTDGTVTGVYELCGGFVGGCRPVPSPTTIVLVNEASGRTFSVETIDGAFTAMVPPGTYAVGPPGAFRVKIDVNVRSDTTTTANVVGQIA
jgi:hypothetical protein